LPFFFLFFLFVQKTNEYFSFQNLSKATTSHVNLAYETLTNSDTWSQYTSIEPEGDAREIQLLHSTIQQYSTETRDQRTLYISVRKYIQNTRLNISHCRILKGGTAKEKNKKKDVKAQLSKPKTKTKSPSTGLSQPRGEGISGKF
jgi:hypothetical protein